MRVIPYPLLVLPALALHTRDRGDLTSCRLMQPLWATAATVLNTTSSPDCYFLDQFYYKLFATIETYAFPAATIRYIPEWKAANTAIRCNLETARKQAVSADLNVTTESLLFTLVREPLDRFISGFSEISAHSIAEFCSTARRSPFEHEELDSLGRAQMFLQNLVAGDVAQECWLMWHVWSMLGPLRYMASFESTVPHVGKMEDFEAQWAQLSHTAGTPFPAFDYDCGAHPESSLSTFPPRQNMDKMVSLKTEQRGARTLNMILHEAKPVRAALVCSVLLPDYVCFKYDFPDGPDMCIEAGFSNSTADWAGIVSGIREHFCAPMA